MPRWAQITLTLVLFAASSSRAPAQGTVFFTGNEVHDGCVKEPDAVTPYVIGVIDGLGAAAAAGKFTSTACIPAEITGGQLGETVCRYLLANPGERHKPGGGLVNTALSAAYPCGGK
ncbi:Rap1a/Tai family immunity protein [Methylobacterium brachythecii]|uniref:Rap1a immunity protein domain-containing protein n=1 Tax=Methylobacterium brachythecii TaxID=1176177 RepID=A0A7W6F947_9HYPH|nr:Rap1a/Tai family immunity protein [Methylobacterium brachythecii]MBB3905133.1 hypothetical protein [Methylobacterium brachythecii]GLS44359.1 hypothetical protein GCM10007884_23470 [Methylobacterium brachythecii]